jgi:hypothetical protein
MEIRLAGIGLVTIEELEARLSAYMNAGAREPIIEGTPAERKEILELISARGDSQMKSLVNRYLMKLEPAKGDN